MDVPESDKVSGSSGDDHEDEIVKRLPHFKNLSKIMDYLTTDVRQAFTQLRQTFTEALILRHFDPKYYIRIETDALGYAIGDVLSQLTNLGQWHPIVYYSQKIIPAKTW